MILTGGNMGIPHIIHYIWFGRNPKPEIVKRCIESWKKYLPEYQIIEWNEDNYDLTKCTYLKQAYDNKKWAFASDFARFDILNQYGGIYLDTDVELLRPLPENLLSKGKAFCGMESTGAIAPGLIFACEAGFPLLQEIIDDYKNDLFIIDNHENNRTVNVRIMDILKPKGFLPNNRFQNVAGMDIYPSTIFCGYDLDVHDYDVKPETIAVHHYSSSWQKKGFKFKAQRYIYRLIGRKNYKKLLFCIRRVRGY